MKTVELKNLLNKLKTGLGTKTTEFSSTDFHFIRQFIFTYKDDFFVLGNNDFVDDIDNVSVCGKDLLKALSVMGEEIEVNFVDNSFVIKSKGSVAKLAVSSSETAKDIFDSLMFDWMDVPETFCNHLHLAAASAASNDSAGELKCVLLTKNRIEATDGQRAIVTKSKVTVDNDVLLSSAAIKKMPKVFSKMSITDSFFAVFEEETGCIFCLSIWGGEYFSLQPTVNEWKSEDGEKLSVIIPQELVKIAKELASFVPDKETTQEDEKTMTILYKEKVIQCVVETNSIKITKKIKNETGTKDFGFEINAFVLSKLPDLGATAYILNDKLFFEAKNITYIVGL